MELSHACILSSSFERKTFVVDNSWAPHSRPTAAKQQLKLGCACQINVALAKRKKKQRRKSCAFAWAINSQLDEVQLLSRERHLCYCFKNRPNGESRRQRPLGNYDGVGGRLAARAIVSPLRHRWRCANQRVKITPKTLLCAEKCACILTYSYASLGLHALKSKKTNFLPWRSS